MTTDTSRTGISDRTAHPLRTLAQNYDGVHTTLGLLGNLAFLVGSVLFLFESLKTAGIWLFIAGAGGMLVGSIGRALVEYRSRDG